MMPSAKVKVSRSAASEFRMGVWLCGVAVVLLLLLTPQTARCNDPDDPLLELLIKKGLVTQKEAEAVKVEAQAMRSNNAGTSSGCTNSVISRPMNCS